MCVCLIYLFYILIFINTKINFTKYTVIYPLIDYNISIHLWRGLFWPKHDFLVGGTQQTSLFHDLFPHDWKKYALSNSFSSDLGLIVSIWQICV